MWNIKLTKLHIFGIIKITIYVALYANIMSLIWSKKSLKWIKLKIIGLGNLGLKKIRILEKS